MIKPNQTHFDHLKTYVNQVPSSSELRFTLTNTVKTLLQKNNHNLITSLKQTPKPETFLDTLKTHPQTYQASMSCQIAADLPPDIEQTSIKDELKDWFIKTADFGDNSDRILQHRDGEYTQLLEDINRYQQIFQEGCDKIILIRPPTYTGYDIQLAAAMQCLGYTPEQFQFIIVQPFKLHALHKPTQKLHVIPDIAAEELIKSVGINALRWHSMRFPLTEAAPLNISTAGQPTPEDSFFRVQLAYVRCCNLLNEAKTELKSASITEHNWNSSHTATLANQIKITPEVLQ
ncbi:MAG: hypothetical protein WA999_14190, partial [Spirulinaceae cyanobacterium]